MQGMNVGGFYTIHPLIAMTTQSANLSIVIISLLNPILFGEERAFKGVLKFFNCFSTLTIRIYLDRMLNTFNAPHIGTFMCQESVLLKRKSNSFISNKRCSAPYDRHFYEQPLSFRFFTLYFNAFLY